MMINRIDLILTRAWIVLFPEVSRASCNTNLCSSDSSPICDRQIVLTDELLLLCEYEEQVCVK